jgi:hypothetical protein
MKRLRNNEDSVKVSKEYTKVLNDETYRIKYSLKNIRGNSIKFLKNTRT